MLAVKAHLVSPWTKRVVKDTPGAGVGDAAGAASATAEGAGEAAAVPRSAAAISYDSLGKS